MISSYHFHRMFRLVFHEPPGQYLRRMRLQSVIFALINWPKMAVTDIALEYGFSSSQSLAKSLRRELNISARDIRLDYQNKGWHIVEVLLKQLGQPTSNNEQQLEAVLAENLSFQIVSMPERHLQVESYLLSDGMIEIMEAEENRKVDILTITPIKDIDKPAVEQKYLMGYEVTDKQLANLSLPSGRYLSCRVKLNNLVTYAAIWNALYRFILAEDLQPSPDGFSIEVFHYIGDQSSGEYDVSFTLALEAE